MSLKVESTCAVQIIDGGFQCGFEFCSCEQRPISNARLATRSCSFYFSFSFSFTITITRKPDTFRSSQTLHSSFPLFANSCITLFFSFDSPFLTGNLINILWHPLKDWNVFLGVASTLIDQIRIRHTNEIVWFRESNRK